MSNSNILILNGSPHKDGHTMTVTKALFKDNEPIIIHAYDMHVNACDDCKVCHYKPSCKFNDDMDKINLHLDQIDTLVIASPIYFGSLSDQLMRIINRFQPFFEKKFTHNVALPTIKNIYLISTCASKTKAMFDGPHQTLNILADLFEAKNKDALTLTNTDNIDDILSEYKDSIAQFKQTIQQTI